MIISLLLIFILSNLGCIDNKDSRWIQNYSATYDQILNSSAICQEFKENNILFSYSAPNEFGYESISFDFGKGVNNDSIESSSGGLGIFLVEECTHLSVKLNRSKYPPVKDKKQLSHQRPLLEKSMEYILEIIYNATDQWPYSKNIIIGDTY